MSLRYLLNPKETPNTYTADITLRWIDGTKYLIALPQGGYTIEDIIVLLHNLMEDNGFYLLTNRGTRIFYAQLVWNGGQTDSRYEARTSPIPSELPIGWTLPKSAKWTLPPKPTVPQLIIKPNICGEILSIETPTSPAHHNIQFTKWRDNSDMWCNETMKHIIFITGNNRA